MIDTTTNSGCSITPEMLARLTPLCELGREALAALAAEAEVERVQARGVVFRRGEEAVWTRYLLTGSVLLTERAGGDRRLVAGEAGAVMPEPLGLEAEHSETALTISEARFLRLPTARIEQLLRRERRLVQQAEVIQAELGVRLFYRLFEDLQADRLELPSMPEIAVRVREGVNREDAAAPELARIIQSDPVLAARVVRAANATIYSGQMPADNLLAAILRLGLHATRELVTAVTLREVFHTSSALLSQRMGELWRHSTLVASIASVLARRLPGFAPERALLAGLVHDIGVVPMLVHARYYPQLIEDPRLLDATIAEFRGAVGSMILQRWNFPADLVALPAEAECWRREHPGGADYADLIVIAQLQVGAGRDLPAPRAVPAYQKLCLAAGHADAAALLVEAQQEAVLILQMLNG